MYFQPRGGGGPDRGRTQLDLLDGDRIAVLAALLVQDLLKDLPTGTRQPTVSRLPYFLFPCLLFMLPFFLGAGLMAVCRLSMLVCCML